MSEEKKEEQLNITVRNDQNEVLFRIKKTTPLGKLMTSYCDRQGKTLESVRFLFDGKRIEKHNTPDELEMDDGDIIEAMVEQQGGGEDEETHINVKVASGDSEVFFKIRKTTPLLKLMNSYCQRQNKSLDSVKFLVDGSRINGEQTPEQLEMEDGDTIEVVIAQVGGQ